MGTFHPDPHGTSAGGPPVNGDVRAENSRWLRELVLELRLLDVGGREIGDAVASAREFLADSGAGARETFGSARSYAAELGLTPGPAAGITRGLLASLAGLLGFFIFIFSVGPAVRGTALQLGAAELALASLALILAALAPRYLGPVLRMKTWQLLVIVALLTGSQLGLALAFDHVVLLELPALPVAVMGAAVLLASALWSQFRSQAEDPVTDPLAAVPEGRGARALGVLSNWLLVGAAPVFAAVDLLLLRS